MKKGMVLAVAGLALSMGTAFAGGAPAQIGVVNVQQIFASSPMVQKQKATLQSDFKAKQAKLQATQKQLQDLVGKYQRDKAVMTAAQKKQAETQMAALQSNLIQMDQSFSQQANQAQAGAMQAFLSKLQTASQKVAQAKHLDLVLPNTSVIYSSGTLDVTKDVQAAM